MHYNLSFIGENIGKCLEIEYDPLPSVESLSKARSCEGCRRARIPKRVQLKYNDNILSIIS